MKLSFVKTVTLWGILIGLCYYVSHPNTISAHAELIDSDPAPGAILTGAPEQIRLVFNEPVAPSSTFVLYNKDFAQIPVLVFTDASTPDVIVGTQIEIIESGVYTVQWVTISADGHPIDGAFSFAVEFENQNKEHTMELIAAAESTAINLPGWFAWMMVALAIVVPFVVFNMTRK